MTHSFKSGYVAIVGAPNAGKSTLMNRLLKTKISIISKKPQTTRNRILGVLNRPGSQMIFLDTPGVHRSQIALNAAMVETALATVGDVDLILFLADVSEPDLSSETYLIDRLKQQDKPVFLALNKTDRIKDSQVRELLKRWEKIFSPEKTIGISAKHGDNTETLMTLLEGALPNGPALFPEDMMTDMPERFFVAELIREKVFRLTGQEIPYSVAVTVDRFHAATVTKIDATIHVERDSQKGIVIGKKGAKLKQIGMDARKDIERMLGTKVYLELFVRVQKNWSRDTKAIRRFGV